MTYYISDSLAAYKSRNMADPYLSVVGGESAGTTLGGAMLQSSCEILGAAEYQEMNRL